MAGRNPLVRAISHGCLLRCTRPRYRHQDPSSRRASSSERRRASRDTSAGTHFGKGVSFASWRPDAVWTSRTCASRFFGKHFAAQTNAVHRRRWTKVIFPFTRRHTRTSSRSRMDWVTSNISWLRGCAHQLPRIGPPATAAATEGTGPVADSRTTPCLRTNADAWRGVNWCLVQPNGSPFSGRRRFATAADTP